MTRTLRGEGKTGDNLALTPRQQEILELLQAGRSNKEVARALSISEGTVKQHLVGIYRHLKVSNRTQAARLADRGRDFSLFSPHPPSAVPPSEPLPSTNYAASLQPVSLVLVRFSLGAELVHRLGSEGFGRLQRLVREGCMRAAERHGGVLQGVPGGMLLLFGIPRVREDDPERAACAGATIAEALSREETLLGEALPYRLCVMTGEVVVLNEGGRITVHGDLLTPSCSMNDLPCAQRRDRLCFSPATRQHLQRLRWRYGSPLAFPGVIPWRETGEEKRPREPDRVGRQGELGVLRERLRQAGAGESRAVVILGEAGFGKSFLIEALRREEGKGVLWLTASCQSYLGRVAFHPVAMWLAQLAGAAGAEDWTARVERWLAALPGDQADPVRELLSWVNGTREISDAVLDEGVARVAQRLQEVLGRRKRVVLVLDNLQWADAATQRLFPRLVAGFDNSRVWLLAAGRRAELRRWSALPLVEQLPLRRLVQKEALRLLEAMCRRRGREEMIRLEQWCGGVPLFLVESARHIKNAGLPCGDDQENHWLGVSLLSLVLERLDRAGVDWRVARAVAAEGRVTLARVQGLKLHAQPATTLEALEQMTRVGVLQENGEAGHREFRFANALVRAAVWHTLPLGDRLS